MADDRNSRRRVRAGSAAADLPRPDYGDGRGPTAHSIMFGGSNKPSGAVSLEKPPNKPQGPHADGRAGLERAMRAAQQKGELADIRPALLPASGPVMRAGMEAQRERVPHRVDVLERHILARSNSLDRHEAEHKRHSGRKRSRSANTEEHLQSLLAATDLNLYSTTHHLGRKPAGHKFTKGKGEAGKEKLEDLFDAASVRASSAGRPGLREEYEAVHAKRVKVLQPYLDGAPKKE